MSAEMIDGLLQRIHAFPQIQDGANSIPSRKLTDRLLGGPDKWSPSHLVLAEILRGKIFKKFRKFLFLEFVQIGHFRSDVDIP